ncbi:BTAD domain-containing putative transcriptional regulator [Brevibacillus reuszeri]|nr:BTAD domain-containing putative transcriptional regulator [Brevibacillus reuszeri]MED1857158.1 BTAD domain-containing putative transcriptional regulator [Brevibacillus reuszeri]
MMKIFESKLSPPEMRKCLTRERLFHFLDQNLHKKVISITSEGGYGKTTLVSSYVQAKKVSAVWYRLEASDRDPLVFLSYLKAGLRPYVADSQIEKEKKAVQSHDLAPFLQEVSDQLASVKERLLIILDDYHHLKENEEVRQVMIDLLRAASPHVTFIMNGRMKPDLPLIPLKLRQQLAELTSPDLAFTRDEIEIFFRELFDLCMTGEEIQSILQRTEGWAASLVLLWDVLKNLNNRQRKHFITHMDITDDIYSYLVTEVLGQQSPELQRFLLHTSLLEELDPNIINRWLGITDAQKKLDHLQAHHLFLNKDHRGLFRYHQLFKAFLYLHVKGELSQAELNEKHARLGEIYESNHLLLRAFVHYTWGNEYAEAARLMRIMVNRYRPDWFLHVVDGALESVAAEHSLATTSLFLFRCVPLEVLETLIPALEESIDRHQHNSTLAAQLQHRLANILFYRGDLKRSLEFFHSSAAVAEQVQDFALVALNLSMASQIYRLQEYHDDAIRYARQSLAYSEQHAIPPHVLMHGLWNLAEVLLEQKEPESAEIFILQAIEVSESCDEASKAFPYSSMGKLYRLRQDYVQAIEWGQKAVKHAARFHIDTDKGWASKELGITYLHTKQLDLAEHCLRAAQQFFLSYTYLHEIIGNWLQKLGRRESAISPAKPEALMPIASLFIQILGELHIKRGKEDIKIARKSSLYLFLLLLTHRGSKLTKDYIMEELFPEDEWSAAQNKFYVSLSILRKSLEPELEFGRKSTYVKQQGDNYFLCMDHIHVDADVFLQDAGGRETSATPFPIDQLLQAEACYLGDFARDFPFQTFLAMEREKLRAMYLHLAERLARYFWESRQFEQGMYFYDKLLTVDPYCEHIYREYTARLLEEKLVLKAKNVYDKGKRHMEQELGIPLSIDDFPEPVQKSVRKK